MSRLLTSEHLLRYGPQIIAAIGAGLAFAWTVHEARAETAESLIANPKRLEMVQAGCKTNQPWATEALCREAAQAIRLRFRGAGVRYTPHRVEPYPSRPAVKHPVAPGSPPPGRPEAHAWPHPSPIM